MKNDHYEEEGRRQAVNKEIDDIRKKENAPRKNNSEIVKEASSKVKRFFIDFIEIMVLLTIIYFVVIRRILPPPGPPYEMPIASDYILAIFVTLVIYAGYYLIKHIIKSQMNKRNKE